MSQKQWMIYGANGYTGKLIAETFINSDKSLNKPILAGRSRDKISTLADELSLPFAVVDLNDSEALEAALNDIDVVLHCAGPFSATSAPMVEACIKTSTHYLDITGEFSVLEAIKQQHSAAVNANCSLIPAVGFDVVPTDCLANKLHEKMPDASSLIMAFSGEGAASPGTMKTMVEMLANGGFVRKEGVITAVPVGYKKQLVPFSDQSRWCMTIPWGDISSAYTSTGINNIEIYTAVEKRDAIIARAMNPLMGVLKFQALQRYCKNKIEANVAGPDAATRAAGCMRLWGQVTNDKGESMEACLDVAEGYQFTALSALAAVEKVLGGGIPAGVLTPAQAFGHDFVMSIESSEYTLR